MGASLLVTFNGLRMLGTSSDTGAGAAEALAPVDQRI